MIETTTPYGNLQVMPVQSTNGVVIRSDFCEIVLYLSRKDTLAFAQSLLKACESLETDERENNA